MTKGKTMLNCHRVSPTEEYIRENEYVMSLKRRVIAGKPRIKYRNPLLRFFLLNYRLIKNLTSYVIEIIEHREKFLEIKRMKGIKGKCDAIVIGNGPSQGYLSQELLVQFKRRGGEIFAVNFWQLNERLSSIRPDYLVISDPATLSFDTAHAALKSENLSLLSYLKSNENIKIVCPFSRKREINSILTEDRVICFADTELIGVSNNISPILPRGYISMTLYKALALALWFGYKDVYVIGMDNTYPRNIFSDSKNKVLNLEKHAGLPDTVVDQSAVYRNIAELLEDLSVLFRDIWKFSGSGRVINLDEYSLTDAFMKLNIKAFERQFLAD